MADLVLNQISKSFGTNRVVDGLSLSVDKGQFVSLLGPSGCGKTTTLRMIAGLITPSGGTLIIKGQDVTQAPPYRRDIGMVFQNYALFPHLTVAENIAFGLQMRKVPRADIRPRVERALEMVRLPGYGGRYPKQLSGGQQQRIALARALVVEPAVLLLDEPLSNLDAKLRDEMRVEIRELQQELQVTTIFVTHDQEEALVMSDQVAVMNGGRIEQLGRPDEIYERPATAFVASFMGVTNLLSATVLDAGSVRLGDGSAVALFTAGRTGAVKVAIRPERLALGAVGGDETALSGRLEQRIYLGNVWRYRVRLANGDLLEVEEPAAAGVQRHAGDEVTVRWPRHAGICLTA